MGRVLPEAPGPAADILGLTALPSCKRTLGPAGQGGKLPSKAITFAQGCGVWGGRSMDKYNVEKFSASTSRKWGFISLACGAPVFFAFYALGDPVRGRTAAVFVSVLVFSIRFRWDLRRRTWFWATIIVLMATHCLALFYFSWPNSHGPAIFFVLPAVFADFALSIGAIYLAEKLLFPQRSS
jgi:hypothetical protein